MKDKKIIVNVNDAIRHYNRNRGTKPKMTQETLAKIVFAGQSAKPESVGYYFSKWSDGDYTGVKMANALHIMRIVVATGYPKQNIISIQ